MEYRIVNKNGDEIWVFGNGGLFYCYDVHTLAAPLYEILEPQGIKSMLQCVLGETDSYLCCPEKCAGHGETIAGSARAAGDDAFFLKYAQDSPSLSPNLNQTFRRDIAALSRVFLFIRCKLCYNSNR